MSTPPDPAAAGQPSTDDPTTQLPPEIWEKVIAKLRNDDLKRVRLVNTTFNDFAIPPLFRCVCFSLVQESHARLLSLSKNEKLSQRVERLYLDTTSYIPTWPSNTYTQAMSNGFADALGVPRPLFKSGPLSGQNLLKVLRTDPSLSLNEGHLNGKPRTQFFMGYGQYCARGDFQVEKLKADGIYNSLIRLLPCFKQLNHVETVTSWTRTDDYGQKLESYLYHSLPEASFKLIPGLRDHSIPRIKNDPKTYGEYAAPGIAARRLNFMCPEALSSLCWGQEMVHEMVSAAFRALQETKIKLESLSLPGSDYIGYMPAPKDRKGIVTISPLCTVPREPGAEQKTLLLPLFEHLKKLELQIDHSHPGTRSMIRCDLDWNRLPRALQSMKNIESLSIGYMILPRTHGGHGSGPAEPMGLYETMLAQDEDFENPEVEDEDDQNAPNGGNPGQPPTPAEFLNMLSAMFGMPPPPPPGAASTNGTQNTHPSQAAPPPPPHAHTTMSAFAITQGPNGEMIPIAAPSMGSGSNPNTKSEWPVPEDPLSPNPWPKLKHLKLWNMPARKIDVLRLFKTIGPNLRSLEMHNVYYTSISNDDIEDMPPLEDITNTTSNSTPKAASKSKSQPTTKPLTGLPSVDQWYETIETLGYIPLILSACEIELGEYDWERLNDTLSGRVEGWGDISVDVDDALSTYLLEGKRESRAMGFAMHVAQLVNVARGEVDDWEDEDEGEFSDSDDESEEGEDAEG